MAWSGRLESAQRDRKRLEKVVLREGEEREKREKRSEGEEEGRRDLRRRRAVSVRLFWRRILSLRTCSWRLWVWSWGSAVVGSAVGWGGFGGGSTWWEQRDLQKGFRSLLRELAGSFLGSRWKPFAIFPASAD